MPPLGRPEPMAPRPLPRPLAFEEADFRPRGGERLMERLRDLGGSRPRPRSPLLGLLGGLLEMDLSRRNSFLTGSGEGDLDSRPPLRKGLLGEGDLESKDLDLLLRGRPRGEGLRRPLRGGGERLKRCRGLGERPRSPVKRRPVGGRGPGEGERRRPRGESERRGE